MVCETRCYIFLWSLHFYFISSLLIEASWPYSVNVRKGATNYQKSSIRRETVQKLDERREKTEGGTVKKNAAVYVFFKFTEDN